MPANEALRIVVDTHVRLSATVTPRKLVEALRRQLRQHGPGGRAAAGRSGSRALLGLLRAAGGEIILPQALLSRVTELCRRHEIAFEIDERRVTMPVSPLHSRQELDTQHSAALRQVLLRDSGVIVAPSAEGRWKLAAEVIARRQQRTLVFCASAHVERLMQSLREALDLSEVEVCRLSSPLPAPARIVVTTYDQPDETLDQAMRADFGAMVFEDLSAVEVDPLLACVGRAGARYLLGLADRTVRDDGLEALVFLALGGVLREIGETALPRGLRLACRRRQTPFSFPYEGRGQYQALLAALARDEQRNRQIVDDLAHEARAGQPCIVLSERRDHLELLREALAEDLLAQLGTITSDVRPAERTAIADRFNRGELTLLFVTSQIAAASALPLTRATRLFVTFPFAYERKLERFIEALLQPAPDKVDVIVYDYDDAHVVPLHRACDKRIAVVSRLQRSAHRDYLRWAQLELQL